MRDIENIIIIIGGICVSIVIVIMFGLFFGLTYDFLTWVSCSNKYEDSQYTIFGWCMVWHNWKYIPEDIYKNAFEKNFNLQLNE